MNYTVFETLEAVSGTVLNDDVDPSAAAVDEADLMAEVISAGTTPTGWGIGEEDGWLYALSPCCADRLNNDTTCRECGKADYEVTGEMGPWMPVASAKWIPSFVAFWTGYAEGDLVVTVEAPQISPAPVRALPGEAWLTYSRPATGWTRTTCESVLFAHQFRSPSAP